MGRFLTRKNSFERGLYSQSDLPTVYFWNSPLKNGMCTHSGRLFLLNTSMAEKYRITAQINSHSKMDERYWKPDAVDCTSILEIVIKVHKAISKKRVYTNLTRKLLHIGSCLP